MNVDYLIWEIPCRKVILKCPILFINHHSDFKLHSIYALFNWYISSAALSVRFLTKRFIGEYDQTVGK